MEKTLDLLLSLVFIVLYTSAKQVGNKATNTTPELRFTGILQRCSAHVDV